jgi:predicted nucleic acid-binding protein
VKPVFLDTVGLIAVWDDSDQWHKDASPVFMQIVRAGRALVTTQAVLLECGNAVARRPYRADVDAMRRLLMAEASLIEPDPRELENAWAAYLRGEAGDAGIVDQISFAVMRRLGLTEAFTNDRHFQAAGFTTLF